MDSIDPAKKRKAASDSDPPRPSGNDDPGSTLPADLSVPDLHRLIDQRVTDALEAVEAKTLALTSRVDCLQRENEGLLRRCESLERSVQVLKKEGNWTYSAPDVPRSHWIDQGHDEDYVEDAEKLIQSIKYCTRVLRLADGDDVGVSSETGTLILPNSVLDPHWEQLANAIQLSERITRLMLWDIQLDERTLQMIEACVRQKGITEFSLQGNQFLGGEGVKFAIDVLKGNRQVGYFGWSQNSFQSTEDACELVDAVLEHPTISEVVFTSSFHEDITTYSPVKRFFCGLGTDTLLEVYLINNGIETNGDRCIPEFLSADPPLRTLDLDGNQLTDDDALHIAVALQSNTHLRVLALRDNSLTENGKSTMHHQAIFGISPADRSAMQTVRKANLNTVSGANHTCQIFGLSSIIGLSEGEFMNDGDKSAKWNRGKKLYLQLVYRHLKGHNMTQIESEFSKDGMGLVPHVLASINTYANAYEADDESNLNLSLLFELARDWKTPEMYQFQHFKV